MAPSPTVMVINNWHPLVALFFIPHSNRQAKRIICFYLVMTMVNVLLIMVIYILFGIFHDGMDLSMMMVGCNEGK